MRTYSRELDQETRQRCRAAERLLKETMAAAPGRGTAAPAPPWPPPTPGAFWGGQGGLRVPVSPTAAPPQLSRASPPEVELAERQSPRPRSPPEDGEMAPLRPVKKRARAPGLGRQEGAGPEPAAGEAAPRGGGTAKSLLGGSGGAKSLLGGGGGAATACRQPALIPAEQYLEQEDWLEDDLGGSWGGRKRPRREPQDPATSSGDSTGSESDGGGPAPARQQPRRRRSVQSRLTRLVERIPTGRARERRPPEAAGSPPLPAEGEGSPPCPPPPPPPPAPPPPPTLRVRVRVQDNVFLIPVPQR